MVEFAASCDAPCRALIWGKITIEGCFEDESASAFRESAGREGGELAEELEV